MNEELEKVISRLKQQYKVYEREMDEDGFESEEMIDVGLACSLAESTPYLIEQIEELDADRDYWKEKCLLLQKQ